MHRVFRHGSVDSTNERAFAALASATSAAPMTNGASGAKGANAGARDGDVHVALEQTAGRGSRGRGWWSPPGLGLYASVIVLPEAPGPSPAALTMAAALAARDAVAELGARELNLKWPNDVLAAGAKLCGILVESRGLVREKPAFVCGIGINLLQRDFPPEIESRGVTSLALLGAPAEPERVLEALLRQLDARLAQAFGPSAAPAELARAFAEGAGLAGAAAQGREIVVRRGERARRGRVEAFGLAGLRLRTPDGVENLPLEHITAVELC